MTAIITPTYNEITRDVSVPYREGLHVRPATELVKLLRTFRSEITVVFGGESADARSIMSVLLLAAPCRAVLTFTARGDDAVEALLQIENLFAQSRVDFS